MIYASVYFTMLYKDIQKLEKTRKYRKPMPVNQRVLGSSPSSGATEDKSSEMRVCPFSFCRPIGNYQPFFMFSAMIATSLSRASMLAQAT